jgi:hypothetical protein
MNNSATGKLTKTSTILVLMLVMASCTSSKTISEIPTTSCLNVELTALFENPHPFSEQIICTQGYFEPIPHYGSFVSYTLHPKQFPSDDELFAYALKLKTKNNPIRESLGNIKRGTLISVKGKLADPGFCWETPSDGGENLCVPIKKPLVLELYSLTR